MKLLLIWIGTMIFFGGVIVVISGDATGVRPASLPKHALLIRFPLARRGKSQYYPRANAGRRRW